MRRDGGFSAPTGAKFWRVKAFVVEHSEQLKLQNKKALVDIFESKDMQSNPMSCFCALFLKRYLHRLSGQQIAGVEGWERDLWVSETELVEKFLQMLQRREADLKMLGASSVEQLFSGHNKKTDLDLRFRYDFIRRHVESVSAVSDQEQVKAGVRAFGAEGGANACEDCSRLPSCISGRDCFRESAAAPKASQELAAVVWEY